MNSPYYDFSVPIFIKGLNSLLHLLGVASALSSTKQGGEHEVLEARLAPGIEIPVFDDNETTISELIVRVQKTITFLESLTPSQFEDAASRRIELKYFPGKHFTGEGYLKAYALPNFFFHLTTAYDILRHSGAPLGKADYMHGLPLQDN
jgi:uncharacterized protein